MNSVINDKHALTRRLFRNATPMLWVLVGLFFFSGCIIADLDDDDDFGNNNVVAREAFSIDVDVTTQALLRFDGVNGNVEILGRADAAAIRITGEKEVGSNSRLDAERRLDDIDILVDDRADEIIIRTLQPDNTQGRNYVVNYTITLPADLAVSVTSVNGNIIIADIDNDVLVNNINGNVRLDAIFGNALVNLTNGNIDSEVVMPLTGSIEQTTTNGNITLNIPTTTSADFSARVTNGNIGLDNLTLRDATRTNQSLTGQLGDGDGTIELRTVNGNVSVNGF